MIWVGRHFLLVGLDDLGVNALYSWVHHAEEAVHDATGALGGMLAWPTHTVGSAVVGLVIGTIVIAVMQLIPRHGNSHWLPRLGGVRRGSSRQRAFRSILIP